jgi:serine/threonine-protein kinase
MSDLYAVGVIAFEMLTGRLPFEGPNALSIAHSHVNDAPPRASTRAPVPAPLDDLVLQLLAKDPSERPQSAALVRERLKRMTPHLGLRVQPVPQLPMARDVRSLQTTLDGTSPTVRVRPSVDELPTLTMPTAELHARALRRSWVLPIAGAVALALGGTGLYVASRGTAPAPAEGRPLPGAAQAGAAGSARANSGESTTGVRAVPQAKDEGRALTASPPAATAGTAGSVVAGREVAPEKEPVRAVLPVESGSAPAGKGTRGDGTVKANGAPVQAPAASGGKPVESRTAAAARAVGLPSSPEPTAPAPRLVAPAPAQREPLRPVPEVRPAPAPAQGLPGKVRLLVKGWGNLTVDGTLLGQFPAPARFPLNAVELKPGTHVLELANGPAQKTWRSVVNVEPGGITELTVAW